jgi:hypothetical protein
MARSGTSRPAFAWGAIALLVKYADYDARGFGTDTSKLWLQAEWAF